MPVDSLEGRNLGKYRVLEPLGRGGMARVYRAYHPQLDRYVAVKVLRSDLVEEEEFLARFRREARAVAALRHPNIVQVFDFDVQGDLYYMVMELLEGDTLATRLRDVRARNERMPLGEVVRVLLDVLEGLGYAHGEGMIHRDVKPANILLTGHGQAVLTDFGIAQIVGGTQYTVSGALMGTLSYMAPEQGLEGQCDPRSDIYSLGIVFYEMLAGEPPFDAETPLAILMKHVHDPLPLPRQREPSIPVPFERIVLKALAKRPGDRYQGAGEMVQALRAASQEAGVDVPARVSLPLSFSTPAAPSESVAVLSGSARVQLRDAEFAAGDTDAQLSRHLPAPSSRAAKSEAPSGRAGAVGPAGPEVTWKPVLEALALLMLFNLGAVFLGIVTGAWGTLIRGWPAELLLAGLVLAAIMGATGRIWLLIPAGILLGNGALLSFYALTEAWPWWQILWPLELLVLFGPILTTIRLARRPDHACDVSQRLAPRLRRPVLILIAVVAVAGLALG